MPTMPPTSMTVAQVIGPVERIRQRWPRLRDAGATGLTIHTDQEEALRLMAELAECRPRD